jgi:hypothetical protein
VSGSKNDLGSAAALPITGRALPQYDAAGTLREVAAQRIFDTIFIPYEKQSAIMERIDALRCSTLGIRGRPLPGLRLSQVSQAGKSKTFEQYILDLKARTLAEGRPENPHQVIYIGLKRRVTVKMLYQRLLMKLGDTHPNVGNLEILVGAALNHAARRDADCVETYDLAHAVRNLAMLSKWVDHNPFPEPGA